MKCLNSLLAVLGGDLMSHREIPIYKDELQIAHQIKANSFLSYASKLEPYPDVPQEVVQSHIDNSTIAGLHDQDLYFVKAILCTSNWNGNDDIFDPKEMWVARHTPSHKPTNIEHDGSKIVGHICEVFPLDSKGQRMSEDTPIDDLPNIYHLVVGSVIYTKFEDQTLQDRAMSLIKEIEGGNKYVSMECFFSDFDYGLKDTQGNCEIVHRNSTTAFLTKHLRRYGGKGSYQDRMIGRVLRNILFTGKGYVDNPANPESIIFNNKTLFDFGALQQKNKVLSISGVSFITEGKTSNESNNFKELKMAETNIIEAQNKEFKEEIKTLKAELKSLQDKHTKDGFQKLEMEVAQLKEQVEERDKQIKAKDEEIDKIVAEKEDKIIELEEITKAKEELKAEIDKTKAEIQKAQRVNDLINVGVSKEDAKTTVETFANLTDKQFEVIVAREKDLVEARNYKMKDDEEKDQKKDKSKADLETETDASLEEGDVEVDDADDMKGTASTDENDDTEFDELVELVKSSLNLPSKKDN